MIGRVYIGYDNRMPMAYGVAVKSLIRHSGNVDVRPLLLPTLEAQGLYNRPTVRNEGRFWDVKSDAPMASEFSLSRFLVPHLSDYKGWSLFTDSDFLFRENIEKLFSLAEPTKAVMVVKHNYNPSETIKMDNQIQTQYWRKNWSSCMLFNNAHPENKRIFPLLNGDVTGKFLHQFGWLNDEQIGELPHEWNWLEGHSPMKLNPKIVHFTRGIPSMVGYEDIPYADEWREYAEELQLCKLVS